MRKTKLPSGEEVPVLGQGTWGMGEHPENRNNEIDALRFGIDVGMTVIDTAEMYGDGASEELVGKAIEERRSKVF
ncbi:MAG: putative 2,5-didehydrogluconate reductase, partial [Massilia sp.]|nr:putative 2,5-didehydrogluconate reductase [Massilia sp.]